MRKKKKHLTNRLEATRAFEEKKKKKLIPPRTTVTCMHKCGREVNAADFNFFEFSSRSSAEEYDVHKTK